MAIVHDVHARWRVRERSEAPQKNVSLLSFSRHIA